MLDGHIKSEESDSPDSYRNVVGYVMDVKIHDKYKAIFIDFAIFKHHPTGAIIKSCIDNDLPIGVSVVIYASDSFRILKSELKRIKPDVVFLDEIYPELSTLYQYSFSNEVIYFTGDGFITRIDLVYKPAFETHTKTIEQAGYIKYNSAKLKLKPKERKNNVNQTILLKLAPQKETLKNSPGSDSNTYPYFAVIKTLRNILEILRDNVNYLHHELKISASILNIISLLINSLRDFYDEIQSFYFIPGSFDVAKYYRENPRLKQITEDIISHISLILQRKEKAIDSNSLSNIFNFFDALRNQNSSFLIQSQDFASLFNTTLRAINDKLYSLFETPTFKELTISEYVVQNLRYLGGIIIPITLLLIIDSLTNEKDREVLLKEILLSKEKDIIVKPEYINLLFSIKDFNYKTDTYALGKNVLYYFYKFFNENNYIPFPFAALFFEHPEIYTWILHNIGKTKFNHSSLFKNLIKVKFYRA